MKPQDDPSELVCDPFQLVISSSALCTECRRLALWLKATEAKGQRYTLTDKFESKVEQMS